MALLAFASTSSALDPATVGRRSFQRTMCTTSAGNCQPIQLVKASRGTHCPLLLLDNAMLLLRVKGGMVWRQQPSLMGCRSQPVRLEHMDPESQPKPCGHVVCHNPLPYHPQLFSIDIEKLTI